MLLVESVEELQLEVEAEENEEAEWMAWRRRLFGGGGGEAAGRAGVNDPPYPPMTATKECTLVAFGGEVAEVE